MSLPTMAELAATRRQKLAGDFTLDDYLQTLRAEIYGLNQIARSRSSEAREARKQVGILRDAVTYYQAKANQKATRVSLWQRITGGAR